MKIDFNAVRDLYRPNQQAVSKGNGKYFCTCCKKTLDEKQFFKTSRTDKHPTGVLPECKTCLAMRVDDTDPMTFLPILKEVDVPYIPSEWRKLLMKKSAKAGSIVGKYISLMHLNQYKKYRWADSEAKTKEETESLLAAMRQETDSESEAEAKVEELTQEEINELKVNWGEDYTEDQYLYMEQMLQDMMESYVIQDPIAISNARMICKMTMKMNKYVDIDDVASASQIGRQLDMFIKSANLAPVQQKDRQHTTFAISQLAFLVEREGGFIPEFYIDQPNDKIDQVLRDMQEYTEYLVRGESNIADIEEGQGNATTD